MARTQLRLGQITGSFGDREGGIIDTKAKDSATGIASIALQSGSLVDVFSHIVSSLVRVHGADTFASNDFGTLKDVQGHTRVTYVDGAETTLNADDGSQKLSIGANIFASASILPEANRTRNLGSSSLKFLEIHGAVTGSVHGNVTNSGVTNDQVVVSNNGALEGDSNFTWDGTLLTLGGASQGTSQLSVSGDATITGDLTVSGVTTTLDTANLLVEDPVILLGKAGTGNSNNGGIAIEQGKASGTGDMVFGRVADDTWGVGTKDTNGGIVTTLADMTLGPMRAGKFEIDGADDHFDVTTSNLTATAAANFVVDAVQSVILDADSGKVILRDGGADTGILTRDGTAQSFVLSSSAGDSITLKSQSGEVFFSDDIGGSSGAINVATATSFKIGHTVEGAFNNAGGTLNLETDSISILSASAGLAIKSGDSTSQIQLFDAGQSNFLAFDAPDLTSDVTYTFPASAVNGRFLQTDTNGDLSWAVALGIPSKGTKIITAVANTANFNSVDDGATLSGFDTTSAGVLDVYVNGQLMSSGSLAQVETNGVRDYRVSADTILRFAFDLEVDDVVVAIKRA
jgi:hypothetical protein